MTEGFALGQWLCVILGGHMWQVREGIKDWAVIVHCERCLKRKIVKQFNH